MQNAANATRNIRALLPTPKRHANFLCQRKGNSYKCTYITVYVQTHTSMYKYRRKIVSMPLLHNAASQCPACLGANVQRPFVKVKFLAVQFFFVFVFLFFCFFCVFTSAHLFMVCWCTSFFGHFQNIYENTAAQETSKKVKKLFQTFTPITTHGKDDKCYWYLFSCLVFVNAVAERHLRSCENFKKSQRALGKLFLQSIYVRFAWFIAPLRIFLNI